MDKTQVVNAALLGDRLRQSRKARELSQADLAEMLGLPQSWISELETGKRPHLDANTLARFSTALGVTTDYLLGLSDAPTTTRRQRPRKIEDEGTVTPVTPLIFGIWKDKVPPDWDAHFDDLDEEIIRMFEGEDEADVPAR